jgi:hypothetical protein
MRSNKVRSDGRSGRVRSDGRSGRVRRGTAHEE